MGWLLEDHEHKIQSFYNESLWLGHLPPVLKVANSIIIAKPDRKDSEKPNNYRPLVIEEMLTKLLENIIACHIQYLLEESGNFPDSQFGS